MREVRREDDVHDVLAGAEPLRCDRVDDRDRAFELDVRLDAELLAQLASQRLDDRLPSVDAAVKGARLFSSDELEDVVLHPPIKRFLSRWQPGDPAVYLGALWAR